MYDHRITYKPETERKKKEIESRLMFVLGLLAFGFIGCLLAWRG